MKKFDQVGSSLESTGLIFALGGAAATVVAPEALVGEAAVKFGAALYAVGESLRDSVSVTNIIMNNGNGSGYLSSQVNSVILRSIPDGPVHDLASSLLDQAEEKAGLENGDSSCD